MITIVILSLIICSRSVRLRLNRSRPPQPLLRHASDSYMETNAASVMRLHRASLNIRAASAALVWRATLAMANIVS